MKTPSGYGQQSPWLTVADTQLELLGRSKSKFGITPAPSGRVAYERVSTARQGRPGLGLEAQREAIDRFAAQREAEGLARFV